MTAYPGMPRDVSAAIKLAEHINAHFSVNVTADEISAYINDNWSKIHVLAHAVHKSEPEPELVSRLKAALEAWKDLDQWRVVSVGPGGGSVEDEIERRKNNARAMTEEALSWAETK